jgi:hypothetical protein
MVLPTRCLRTVNHAVLQDTSVFSSPVFYLLLGIRYYVSDTLYKTGRVLFNLYMNDIYFLPSTLHIESAGATR